VLYFLDGKPLLEQVDGAFRTVKHFFFSLAQLGHQSVLCLSHQKHTFLPAWLAQLPPSPENSLKLLHRSLLALLISSSIT